MKIIQYVLRRCPLWLCREPKNGNVRSLAQPLARAAGLDLLPLFYQFILTRSLD